MIKYAGSNTKIIIIIHKIFKVNFIIILPFVGRGLTLELAGGNAETLEHKMDQGVRLLPSVCFCILIFGSNSFGVFILSGG